MEMDQEDIEGTLPSPIDFKAVTNYEDFLTNGSPINIADTENLQEDEESMERSDSIAEFAAGQVFLNNFKSRPEATTDFAPNNKPSDEGPLLELIKTEIVIDPTEMGIYSHAEPKSKPEQRSMSNVDWSPSPNPSISSSSSSATTSDDDAEDEDFAPSKVKAKRIREPKNKKNRPIRSPKKIRTKRINSSCDVDDNETNATKVTEEYECRFCTKKKFQQKWDRNVHEKYTHLISNSRIYHCQLCTTNNANHTSSSVFARIGMFIKHLREFHLFRKEVAEGDSFVYYFCDEVNCEECFISHELLETHIQKIHVKFNCPAENCTRVFANKVNLNSHPKNVHGGSEDGKGNFGCEYCYRDFKLEEDLKVHKEGHLVKLVEFEHNCDICGKDFRTNRSLTHHKRLSHKNQAAAQTSNDTSSARSTAADKEVLSESNWKCRFCKKTVEFSAKEFRHGKRMDEYKCNRNKYLADKPCLCKICFLCFKSEEELNSHQKEIHVPCKCKICDVQLMTEQGLAFHVLIHSSKGNQAKSTIICKLCNIAFKNVHTLSVHNSVLHSNPPREVRNNEPAADLASAAAKKKKPAAAKIVLNCNYGCEVATFGNELSQRRHHVKHHSELHLAGEAVYCHDCFEVFNTDEELENHSTKHKKYICKHCDKQFSNRNALYNHKFIHMPDSSETRKICQGVKDT